MADECTKVTYPTREAAANEVIAAYMRDGRIIHPYLCTSCRHWHNTTAKGAMREHTRNILRCTLFPAFEADEAANFAKRLCSWNLRFTAEHCTVCKRWHVLHEEVS